MNDMTIKFSDTSRDFSGWMKEKCGNVLLSLCGTLREYPDVMNTESFRLALNDALKIYALCCGNLNGIYCDLVYSLLITYNSDGYFFLKDLISGTKNGSMMQEIFQYERSEEILALIEQNDKLNRTKIASLLNRIAKPNRWTEEVANDLELVHNGVQSWEWFYGKHHDDRHTCQPYFSNSQVREVYEYFKSDEYKTADGITAAF